jgi:hypothetical protein
LPYLPAKRRLRDVQPLRRHVKVHTLGDRNEAPNVPQLNAAAFYVAYPGQQGFSARCGSAAFNN